MHVYLYDSKGKCHGLCLGIRQCQFLRFQFHIRSVCAKIRWTEGNVSLYDRFCRGKF